MTENVMMVALGITAWLASAALAAYLFGRAAHFHRRNCSICRSERIVRSDKRFAAFLSLLGGPAAVLAAVLICAAEYQEKR